jgi:type II secretory pathway predicted ATPase ExeA
MEEHALFYGFSENPFKATPDARFFFLGQSNREALASIIYGINERKGFVLIMGGAGTGKTALVQYLSHKLAGKVPAVIIDQADTTFEQLLAKICLQLDLTPESPRKGTLIRQFNMDLIQRHARGENFVLLIDDAHNVSEEVMDELRLLSNLETRHSKLIQIVLLGQPAIRIKLNSKNLKQFNQRIVIKGRMGRLTEEESRQYIDHHLRLVGGESFDVFTPQALSLICRRAGGVPGTINSICDHAFSIGYQHSAKRIDLPTVKEALNRACRPRQRFSPAWAFGKTVLLKGTTHSVKETIGRVYRQKQRLSRAWALGKTFLLGEISYSGKRALNQACQQKRRLSGVFGGKKLSAGRIFFFGQRGLDRAYRHKQRVARAWSLGKTFLTAKGSYFALAILCLLMGILLNRDQIKINSKKTEIKPLPGNRMVAGKVSAPVVPKGIDFLPGNSPSPALEKIEPLPSAEHSTGRRKGSVHAPQSKRKVPAGKAQVQPSARRNPLPRRTSTQKVPPPAKGRQTEAPPRNSPATSSGEKGPLSLPERSMANGKEDPHKPGIKIMAPESPAIIQSFAPKRLRPGDLCKVYLRALDRNGDMKYILCLLENGGPRLSIIKIKEENQEYFSGYLFFSTSEKNSWLNHTDLTLSIWIKDSAGHLSQPARFFLSLQPDIIPERPPRNLFEEISLGPVMTPLPNPLDTGG